MHCDWLRVARRCVDVCRQLGVSEATFYTWKKKYADFGVSELRKLKQLEDENARLRRIVADLKHQAGICIHRGLSHGKCAGKNRGEFRDIAAASRRTIGTGGDLRGIGDGHRDPGCGVRRVRRDAEEGLPETAAGRVAGALRRVEAGRELARKLVQ